MSNQKRIQTRTFKIVLLGEGCVGKTSLVLRYVENKFSESHQTTLQAACLQKVLTVDNERVKLSIWDTAGQEKFHALGPIYYRDSNGAILVYDVTDPDSLSKVKTWIKELQSMLGNSVTLAVVGNKVDLLQYPNSVNPLMSEAQSYARSLSNATHYATSAKLNHGINELFLDLTHRILASQQANASSGNSNSANRFSGISNSGSTSTANRTLRIADDDCNLGQDTDEASRCNC